MTTYNVTTDDGTIFTNQTAIQVKTLKRNLWGTKLTITKNVTPKMNKTQIKFWYFRGEMVNVYEERQNGYTRCYSDTRGIFLANTKELEYR